MVLCSGACHAYGNGTIHRFALVTGPGWSFYNQWVPAVMFVAMGAFSTPEIEHYLANRYQADWSAYAKRVKWKMVPGVW